MLSSSSGLQGVLLMLLPGPGFFLQSWWEGRPRLASLRLVSGCETLTCIAQCLCATGAVWG